MIGMQRRNAPLYWFTLIGMALRSMTLLFVFILALTAAVAQGQLDELRRLRAEIDPYPVHPKFLDPISPSSPNAAGRYMWLLDQVEQSDLNRAGEIEKSLIEWRLAEWYEGEPDPPDVESWRVWLSEHRSWTDALVEASRLDVYELYRSDEPRADVWAEGDPRRGRLGGMRASARVLTDDASRLWIEGNRDAAIDRAEAIVRIGLHIGSDNGSVIESLVSGAMQRYGLELTERMAAAGPSQEEKTRLITIAALIPDDDPTGIRSTWTRHFEDHDAFIAEQLKTEGGGEGLWLQLGFLVGAQQAVSQIFQPMLNAIENGEPTPSDWPAGTVSVRDVVRAFEEQFENVTHKDLEEAHRQGQMAGQSLQDRWADPDADGLFKDAAQLAEADPTLVCLLMVGHVDRFRADGLKTIRLRDEVLRSLGQRDAQP